MKPMTTRDLNQSLTLLLPHMKDDGEGGWHEEWKKGPRLWASLWPLTSEEECVKDIPPARFRIVIRAGINLPPRVGFDWHLYQGMKRLSVASSPVLIQNNQFLRMLAVEMSQK
jgi:head-tail adaptor